MIVVVLSYVLFFRPRAWLILLLVGQCYRKLCQTQLNLALRRIDSATKSSWGQKSQQVRFTVLSLPFLDVGAPLVDVVVPYVEASILSGFAISVNAMHRNVFSIKRIL